MTLTATLDASVSALLRRREDLWRALQLAGGSVPAMAALAARDELELAAIDAALQRVAEGSFGLCTACHAAIGPGRLAAQPAAALCLACQEAHEARRGRDAA